MDAVAFPQLRSPAWRPASWRVGFLWLNVVVCLLCMAYVALVTLLVTTFSAQQLHDTLGETFYNSWIASGGAVQSLMIVLPLLGLDIVVGVVCSLIGMLRSRKWRLPGAILTAGLLAGATWSSYEAIVTPDPVSDQLWALVMPTDTAYAPGYSESAFRTLEPGMTRAEVLALLGQPLEGPGWFAGNTTHAFYAWSPSWTNYWRREVHYGPDDRVEMVLTEMWHD